MRFCENEWRCERISTVMTFIHFEKIWKKYPTTWKGFTLHSDMKIHSQSRTCSPQHSLTLSRLRKGQKGHNYSSACMKYFTLSITVRGRYKVCAIVIFKVIVTLSWSKNTTSCIFSSSKNWHWGDGLTIKILGGQGTQSPSTHKKSYN